MTRTGATLVVDALVRADVRHLFSLSGNQILSVYDATLGQPIEIIHTRHEAAAVHMADGWGRLTETPGVALVTAGPGHLNALGALYGALMAESPCVLLSGAAPRAQAGRGAFQEIDQPGTARPVVKAAWTAERAETLGDDVARALEIASGGRPGPVALSLPGDLLESLVAAATGAAGGDEAPLAQSTKAIRRETSSPPAALQLSGAQVGEIVEMVRGARRPLILLGPAMARPARRAAVDELSRVTGVPALPIESPRGVNDPWLHMAATRFGEVDVALLLGKRLDFTLRFGTSPPWASACRFIQIDDDPVAAVAALTAAARGATFTHHPWAADLAASRRAEPADWPELRRAARAPMHPLRVCAALQPLLDRGAILVGDGGEFGQWIQAGCEAGTRMINGPAGSIGSAIPLALAAKLRHPERTVIAALGDGTFGFHALELDTAVRRGLPIVVVIGNDARWNAEHQLQLATYGRERTIGCELLPTRYDRLAQSLGCHGERVEKPEDLEPALGRALASGLPACLDIVIDGVAAPTYRAGQGSTHA
ncbi:MAG: thiamine pyrophosphate-binding protein [Candidatus Rokuibacteriota bacterium]